MRHLPSILIALLAAATLLQVAPQPQLPAYCSGLVTPTKPNPTIFRPNPPRVYPFCVGKDPGTGQWDDILVRSGFSSIIEEINERNKPQPPPNPYQGFEYILDDHLFDDPSKPQFETNAPTKGLHVHQFKVRVGNSPSKHLMDNWLLLDLLAMFRTRKNKEEPIRGVYIQGIQGPLGIPFGEFIMHDAYRIGVYQGDITDNIKQNRPPSDWMQMSKAYPCTFYSKAGPTIPNVFMFSSKLNGGRTLTESARRTRVHALFRWEDPVCAEVAFMQFLVIIVYEWGDPTTNAPALYRAGVSPVVLPGYLKSLPITGLAHPFYPDWGKTELETFRTIQMADAVAWSNSNDNYRKYRIVSNFDYEACVQHNVGLVKNGPGKGACPPGPFKCSAKAIANRPKTSTALANRKNDMWLKWSQIYLAFKPAREACDTPPVVLVSTSTMEPEPTLEPLPQILIHEKAIAALAEKVEREKVISHGDLCVFIWSALIPVSNYFARFFKDFPNFPLIGAGFWIVSHVLIHHVGVLFMWMSFGLVVSNGVSFLGGAGLAHYMYGFPVAFIQHYELFDGFVRNRKQQIAARQSAIHVINGYLAGLLSLCCCAYSHIRSSKMYIVYALSVTNVLAFICGNIVEWRISRKLGFFPARKFFPVLERVMMVNAKPRFVKLKIIMACVYILVIAILCILYFTYDNYIGNTTFNN